MNTISETTLLKLKCIKCRLYLSVGPVTSNSNGDFYCGRCPNEGVHIKIYEALADNFVFPCRYQSFGCREIIKWGSVENHERNCSKKPYPCPAVPVGACSWHGKIINITKHFEQKHSEGITHRNMFEMRLHENIEICKLIKTNNEYYVLYLYFNTVQKVLKFNVMQLKDAKTFKAQTYQLTLHAHDFSKRITLASAKCEPYESMDHDSIEERNMIDMSVLNFLTNNNPLVFCEISFDAGEEKKKVNVELFKLIECPICNECMSSPIYQCQTGHSFCNSCTSKLNDCPLCHRLLARTRNYILEDVIGQFLHTNETIGSSGACTKINTCENSCDLYKCPLRTSRNCMWNGNFGNLMEHCKNNHGNYMDSANSGFLYTLAVDNSENFRLFHFNNSLFRFCRKYENKEFSVNIQLVGPGKQPGDYYYECSLVDVNDRQTKLSMENNQALSDLCQVLNEDENSFDNCLKISSSFFKPFKDINSLCCRIVIHTIDQ